MTSSFGPVYMWDVGAASLLRRFHMVGAGASLTVNADGSRQAAAARDHVTVFDTAPKL